MDDPLDDPAVNVMARLAAIEIVLALLIRRTGDEARLYAEADAQISDDETKDIAAAPDEAERMHLLTVYAAARRMLDNMQAMS